MSEVWCAESVRDALPEEGEALMAIPKKGTWEIKDGLDCSSLQLRSQKAKAAELAALKTKPSDQERKVMKHPSHRGRGFAVLNPRN